MEESKTIERDSIINPLLTDYYQLSMAYGYWKNKVHLTHSVFDAFFRKCPFNGQFAVFGGLDEVIQFVKSYKFTNQHIQYLRKQAPFAEEEYWEYLASVDCSSLKIYGIPDGTLVFAKEPLLRIEGPVIIVQLLETTILNLLNYSTLIATNAARFRIAAGPGKTLTEFGLRRAQGPNGALCGSKYSVLGGFDGTSNVLAGMLYDIPISGTMAHSYILSFTNDYTLGEERKINGVDILERALYYRDYLGWTDTNLSELLAFLTYIIAYPNNFLALVDTYNTIQSGVKNFLIAALVLEEIGQKAKGIRLDSGDLAQLSKDARALFIEIGTRYSKLHFKTFNIVASNDIHEDVLFSLNQQGHEIDTYGIGTNLITCLKQPALGMVYKLVVSGETDRDQKQFIDSIVKLSFPLNIAAKNEIEPTLDVMCLTSEEAPEINKDFKVSLPFKTPAEFETVKPLKIEILTALLYEKGHEVYENKPLAERRASVLQQLQNFNQNIFKRKDPEAYPVMCSEKLYCQLHKLIAQAKIA